MNTPAVSICLKANTQPKFIKHQSVPLPIREQVHTELNRMVSEGNLTRVEFSEWDSPIVPVLRAGRERIRICNGYGETVNAAIVQNEYPLPTIPDVLATVSGGKTFSLLDANEAYLQLRVDEGTSKILTINATKGLFKYNRLAFGLSAVPGIFQKFMDSLLAEIKGVIPYLDDIVITGATEGEHEQRLRDTLERLKKVGFRLKKEKCLIGVKKREVLGFVFSDIGIIPSETKVMAMKNTKVP